MSQSQIEAAIVAGAPPKDLNWMLPKVPAAWKKLSTGTGTLQWQTRDGCGLMLDQPGGIGTGPTPTSEGVLEHTAERNRAAFDGNPKPVYSNRTTRKLPNIVEGLHGTSLVTFQEATVDYGKARTQQLAYRNGDFALTFVGFCRDAKSFAVAKKADFEPMLAKLQTHTRY